MIRYVLKMTWFYYIFCIRSFKNKYIMGLRAAVNLTISVFRLASALQLVYQTP